MYYLVSYLFPAHEIVIELIVIYHYSYFRSSLFGLGHGSLYGTHPFLWYAYAGIPAIYGIALPFFLWEVAMLSKEASANIIFQNRTIEDKLNATTQMTIHYSVFSASLLPIYYCTRFQNTRNSASYFQFSLSFALWRVMPLLDGPV
jgi:hypothetical protein